MTSDDDAAAEADERVARWDRRKAVIGRGTRALTLRELALEIVDLMEKTGGSPASVGQDMRLSDMHREFSTCIRQGLLETAWPEGM